MLSEIGATPGGGTRAGAASRVARASGDILTFKVEAREGEKQHAGNEYQPSSAGRICRLVLIYQPANRGYQQQSHCDSNADFLLRISEASRMLAIPCLMPAGRYQLTQKVNVFFSCNGGVEEYLRTFVRSGRMAVRAFRAGLGRLRATHPLTARGAADLLRVPTRARLRRLTLYFCTTTLRDYEVRTLRVYGLRSTAGEKPISADSCLTH